MADSAFLGGLGYANMFSTAPQSSTAQFQVAHLEDIRAEAHKQSLATWAYYLGIPVFLYLLLAPGLFISIPAETDCETGVSKTWSPAHVTIANTFVHLIVFFLIVYIVWKVGATGTLFGKSGRSSLPLPFLSHHLDALSLGLKK